MRTLKLVKNPLDVNRPATDAEIRAANAMLCEISMAADGKPVFDAFSVLTPINQKRILMQVRAVIWSLHHFEPPIGTDRPEGLHPVCHMCGGAKDQWPLMLNAASPMDTVN